MIYQKKNVGIGNTLQYWGTTPYMKTINKDCIVRQDTIPIAHNWVFKDEN